MDCLFLLPLALWQTLSTGYALTQRDLLVAVILGLVCTALAYSLWMEGVRYIRMQHSAVLGFLSPVAAPLFAWALIGQAISVYTAIGGALVLTAGILVVPAASRTWRRSRRCERSAITAPRPGGPSPRRDLLGYAIVLVSYLGMAGSAPLVAWAGAPEAIILMLAWPSPPWLSEWCSCGDRCSPTGAARARPGASSSWR